MLLRKFVFVISILAPISAFASLNPGVQWEVRVGGAASNGGGFDPTVTSPGTDFTQQLTPQFSYTDLVIGATNTQLTSAANPFDATTVGNMVHVSAGTGFTTGWYEILSVSANVATMDRAVGTASSTGGTGVLGGALDLWQSAPIINATAGTPPSGNTIWVRSGTYTYTSTLGTGNGPTHFSVIGYQTTHGDNGTPPVFTTASTTVTPMATSGATTAKDYFHNLKIACPGGSTTDAVLVQGAIAFLDSVEVTGCSHSVNVKATVIISNSYLHGATSHSIFCNTNSSITVVNSLETGATGDGINTTATTQIVTVENSIFANNGGWGIDIIGAQLQINLENNTFATNTSGGVFMGNPSTGGILFGNIFYGNSGWGLTINVAWSGLDFGVNAYNAFGANATGTQQYLNPGIGTVTIAGNPFTNSAGLNYSLNSTFGAVLKGAAGPGMFLNHSIGTTSHLDIGAVQSTGASGGNSIYVN